MYLRSGLQISFEINFISKEIIQAELVHMNIHPPPPVKALALPLSTIYEY